MRSRILAAVRALLPPLLLVALAAAQLWPGLSHGLGAPISWDHGAHLGKAMLTAQEMLPFLRGWSDSVEAGVPLNTLYSVGGTAFVLLVRALTPSLEWEQTYALAVLAVRALVGLSAYRLARAAGGSRVAGFFAGALALADHGDHSEGGWFYDIQFGVWPVSLAIALLMFGLADVVQARREGRTGLCPRAAILFGLSLVSHQMPLLGLIVFAPLYVSMRWLDEGSSVRAELRSLVPTLLLGGLLSAFWLVPMLAESHAMSRHGQLYRSFTELGEGAPTGIFVLRGGAFTVVLCALAMLRGLFARGPRRFYAVFGTLLIVISARDWLVATNLLRFVPALGSIMYPRFLMLAKPLEFALAGLLVGEAVEAALRETRESFGSPRGRFAVALAVLAILPFSRGLANGIRTTAVAREEAYTSTDPLYQDFLAYAAWEREQARHDGFYRVAYQNPESHLFQGAPAFTGVPAHKIGMLIAEVFGNTTPSGSADALRAMNVKRIVFVGPPPTAALVGAHRVAEFGRIQVHDLDDFDGAVAIDPTGATRPRVARLERERVVIRPNGARRLVVRRAIAPRWKARVDGREVPLSFVRVPHAFPLRLMALDVPAGARTVELAYESRSASTVVGSLATLLAILVILGATLPVARLALVRATVSERIDGALDALAARVSTKQAAFGVVGVGLALALVVGLRRGFDARAELPAARVTLVRADGTRVPCDGTRPTGEPGHQCPNAEWNYVGPMVQTVEGELRQCLWAHPAGAGERIEIEFEHAALGRELRVGAGIGDEAMGNDAGAPVRFTTLVDGRELGSIEVPFESDWRERRYAVSSGEHRLVFQVGAPDPSRRFLCFEATSR